MKIALIKVDLRGENTMIRKESSFLGMEITSKVSFSLEVMR